MVGKVLVAGGGAGVAEELVLGFEEEDMLMTHESLCAWREDV